MINRLAYIAFMLAAATGVSQPVGGVLNGNATVCANFNSGTLTVTGYSGSIARWEYAYSPGGPWTPILTTSSAYNYVNAMQTTHFRVAVQSPGFATAYSSTATVFCDVPANSGTLHAVSPQCVNSVATLTLSAYTGSIVGWLVSHDGWISSSSVAVTSPTFAYNNFSLTTSFRAIVRNGVCPQVLTAGLTVVAASQSSAGSVQGGGTICASPGTVALSVSGYHGQTIQWEAGTAASGPFITYAGTSNAASLSLVIQSTTWIRATVTNNGCPPAHSSAVLIQPDAVSSGGYISGPHTACIGNSTVLLTHSGSTGNIQAWERSVNNGSSWLTLTGLNNTISVPSGSASSLFRCRIKNGVCPAVNSGTHLISVLSAPSVTFLSQDHCEGTSVTFTNLSAGPSSYAWSFGDGSGSGISSPVHTYSTAGVYAVRLLATSAAGCADSAFHAVTVYPLPVPALNVSDSVCALSELAFTNQSSISPGSIISSVLHFGDSSWMSNPVITIHRYKLPGKYIVRLKTISAAGCTDSIIRNIHVSARPSCSFTIPNCCVGSTVEIGNHSYSRDAQIMFHWSNGSMKPAPVLTITSTGIHSLSLVCRTDAGCSDTAYGSFLATGVPELTVQNASVCVKDTLLLPGKIEPAGAGSLCTVEFGDGGNASVFPCRHRFNIAGNYMVKITARTDSGCSAAAVQHIRVMPRPSAAFSAQDVCMGDTIRPLNLSTITDGTISAVWKFYGDIFPLWSSRIQARLPGSFELSLVLKSGEGCTDSASRIVNIWHKPMADFSSTEVCLGSRLEFTDLSRIAEGGITKREWRFGDHTSAEEVSPVKIYLTPSAYAVQLRVYSSKGCSDDTIRNVTVHPLPVAAFSVMAACVDNAILIKDKTQLESGSFNSDWSYGDGEPGNSTGLHRYRQSGTYLIKLHVMSDKGCTDSAFGTVTIFPRPVLVTRDTVIEKGNVLRLQAPGARRYSWSPAADLDDPLSPQPLVRLLTTTQFTVTATDENGCSTIDSLTVLVKNDHEVEPYNLVTPDGNNMNDTWIIRNIGAYPRNHVKIADADGNIVFEKSGYQNEWRGTDNENRLLPAAIYYYVLTFENSEHIYKGHITLLRR